MDKPAHHKNLKDLLNNKSPEGFDDFEKEALEGFNTLGSEQEALDLKAALDKRMQAEVLQEKKFSLKVYWYAAAGLVLMIGFSVYFLMNNENLVNTDKVAVIENKKENIAPIDMPAEEVNEKLTDKENSPAAANVKEQVNNLSLNNQGSKDDSKSLASGASTYTLTVMDANGAVAAEMNRQDEDYMDGDKKANTVVTNQSSPTGTVKKAPVEIAAEGKGKESDLLEQTVENKAVYKTDELKKETITNNTINRLENNTKADDKRAEVKTKSPDRSKVGVSNGELASENENEPSDQKNKRKKEDKENEETKVVTDNKLTLAKKSEKPKLQESQNGPGKDREKTSPASPAMDESPIQNAGATNGGYVAPVVCFYSGGENNLMKDVSEKLTEKKLNKKFDATLYINDKKIVQEVKFTNKFDLNKDDEIHIAETLKTLNKFNFSINQKVNSLFEYKLVYRP